VLDIALAVFNAAKTFNAAALPQSPLVHNAAPNIVINQFSSSEPNTQPPIDKEIIDIRIAFQDQ
jgi:hypothetical protein